MLVSIGHRNAIGSWGGKFGLSRLGGRAHPIRGFPCGRLPVCLTAFQACAVAVAIFSGCGSDRGPERVIVFGTVTYNGKPVSGTIRFVPTAASAVPMAAASIIDGAYRVGLRGGVSVGTHTVAIEAYHVPSSTSAQGMAPLPIAGARGVSGVQYLPKRYNTNSELKVTIEPGSREITKSFDLTD